MDKIILQQMHFYGFHGLFPEERKLGQRFDVDIEMYVDLKKAGMTDDMKYSIDYGEAYKVVKNVVEGEAKQLIEAVAELIADRLFATFDLLEACQIRLTKPNPPIAGHYEAVAIEIYREKHNE